jgi:hypothetical protein
MKIFGNSFIFIVFILGCLPCISWRNIRTESVLSGNEGGKG